MKAQELKIYADTARDFSAEEPETAARITPVPERRWTHIHAPDARTTAVSAPRWQGRRRELRIFLSNPNALFGIAALAAIVFAALLAPILYPGDPLEARTPTRSSALPFWPPSCLRPCLRRSSILVIPWKWWRDPSFGRAKIRPIRWERIPWGAMCWRAFFMVPRSR